MKELVPVGVALTDPDRPGWRRPPASRDDLRNDTLLAVGLLVGGLLSLLLWSTAGFYDEPAPAWVSLLCLAGVTLPLAVRRRWPSAVALVVGAVFVVLGSTQVPETLVANICLFVALYTVGAWEPVRRRAVQVRVVVIAGMFLWLFIALFMSTSDPDSMPELSRAGAFSPLVAYLLIQLLTNVVYFAGAYWFGDRSWASARERARTELRTGELVMERRRVAAQAVALERLRLARELHDAVAHHVSMMGVQAGAARTVLAHDPDRVAGMLESVEESAREAIAELHGILGTLREHTGDEVLDGTDAEGSGRAEPGTTVVGTGPRATGADEALASLDVSRLPELVEATTAAGVPATFQVLGDPTRLPPLVSLNLYRIAQEALTNTRKHAGPSARADVRLRYLEDSVELEVTDDGSGRPARTGPSTAPGSGLGLVGIRERVASDGGTLEARPLSRGGFLVRATIPLDRGEARRG